MSETPKPTVPEGRRIYMTGEFNEDKAEKIITSLLDMEAKNPLKDIMLYIDSYGGYVDSFFAIHDTIRMLRCNVATISIGKTMSCGFMLLISGTPGLRFITQNSRVLIHEISSFNFGKVSEMETEINEVKRLQKKFTSLILQYTQISEKELEKIFRKEYYVDANECRKMGIVDHVITSNKDLYRKVNIK